MKTVSVESCWSVGFPNTCHPRALILLLLSIMSIGCFLFCFVLFCFAFWVFLNLGFYLCFVGAKPQEAIRKYICGIILFYSYLTDSLTTCNIVGSKNIFLWTFRGTDLYLFEHTYLLMISVLPHGLLSLSSSLSQSVSFSPR